MRLWRVCNPKYSPLSANGSAINGARWNPVNCPILYLGENSSLVAWERYVHIEAKGSASGLKLNMAFIDLTLEMINSISHVMNLDSDWHQRQDYTQDIGSKWVTNAESAILRVPSVVIQGQYNYLLNPEHYLSKKFLQEVIPTTFPFEYDSRI
jgi:RES domain-containing protein